MGLFPGASCWFGHEFDGWEGVADTCDGVRLGDNCGTEGVQGMAETYPRVWNDSTIAQTEKFDALDCTNSTVGETRVGSCAIGYELASGDSLRALTCVSKNESVACLTGSLPACQVTRCSTSTNLCQLE